MIFNFLICSKSVSSHSRGNHLRCYKMPSQLLKELELKAKHRGIRDYKSMPLNKLLSILYASEPIKENFEDANLL